jgi:hypothetical protein
VTLAGVDINRYAYAGNDPINSSDPNGHLFDETGEYLGIALAGACAGSGTCQAAVVGGVAASGPVGWLIGGVAIATVAVVPGGPMDPAKKNPNDPNVGIITFDKDLTDSEIHEIIERAHEYQRSLGQKITKAEAFEKAKQDVGRGYTNYGRELAKLPPGERVAKIKGDLSNDATGRGWEKDKQVSKLNDRSIYRDRAGNYWSMDTQHGTWEKLDNRGRHQGEFDRNLKRVSGPDRSGKHNIKAR